MSRLFAPFHSERNVGLWEGTGTAPWKSGESVSPVCLKPVHETLSTKPLHADHRSCAVRSLIGFTQEC
jgi:hypothetical protein